MLSLSKHPGALCLVVLLGACSSGREDRAEATAIGEAIPCALGGAAGFTANCTIERDGGKLIVRHPDGGFRRFVSIEQGRGIAAADGADAVMAKRVGSDLEVRVAKDRYLLPVVSDAPTR